VSTGLVHDALIYQSDAEFTDTLVPFMLDGLERGEKVCAVTTAENVELLAATLGSRADEVQFIDSEQWYRIPARTIAAYHYVIDNALSTGSPALRVIGEVEFGGTDIEHADWTRYESILNIAFCPYPAWIICPYDCRRLPARLIADARRTHPCAIQNRQRRHSTQFVEPEKFTAALPVRLPERLLGQLQPNGELRTVRQLVNRTCAQLGLTNDHAAELCLVVGELTTNAIEHGAPPVTVSAWSDERALIYEITDAGPGPTDPCLGFVRPSASQPRGRGLWLSRQLADRVEFTATPEGTSTRVEIRLPIGAWPRR
jgi:anti-sigma regulatory factor (Ser/Thr protein kinase)